MLAQDLTKSETHFAFGQNWASYARSIDESHIREAEKGLQNILQMDRLDGASFLDIGCGSGVHALAALRLGAARVLAVDIDANSVETTRAVLQAHGGHAGSWSVDRVSVFDLDPREHGCFEVVYSWGVLHHTGDMRRAMRVASTLVANRGVFAFALYRPVWLNFFWRREKAWYAKASPRAQRWARMLYILCFRVGMMFTGRSFRRYVERYRGKRGMDFHHDVHDWLGGWPYESIDADEVEQLMQAWGFSCEYARTRRGLWFGREMGWLGSGCDEYLYRKL